MRRAILAAVVLVVSALSVALVWSFGESLLKPTVLYPYEVRKEDYVAFPHWKEFIRGPKFRLDNDDLLHLYLVWDSNNVTYGTEKPLSFQIWLDDVLVSIWHKKGSVVREVHMTVKGNFETFALRSISQYPGVEAKVYLGMLRNAEGYEVRISDIGQIGESTVTVKPTARHFGWPIEIDIETSVEYNSRTYRAVYECTLNGTATN